MNKPERRPTLSELAAAAAGADGWRCRVCGCADWRVVKSTMQYQGRKRIRVCRHCGARLTTYELPLGE